MDFLFARSGLRFGENGNTGWRLFCEWRITILFVREKEYFLIYGSLLTVRFMDGFAILCQFSVFVIFVASWGANSSSPVMSLCW